MLINLTYKKVGCKIKTKEDIKMKYRKNHFKLCHSKKSSSTNPTHT